MFNGKIYLMLEGWCFNHSYKQFLFCSSRLLIIHTSIKWYYKSQTTIHSIDFCLRYLELNLENEMTNLFRFTGLKSFWSEPRWRSLLLFKWFRVGIGSRLRPTRSSTTTTCPEKVRPISRLQEGNSNNIKWIEYREVIY